jgi:UDP-N-acetylmuramoyl-L-alanine---L-glutamate ligase
MRLERLCRQRIGVLGYGREGRSAVSALLGYRPDTDLTVLVESGSMPEDVPSVRAPFDDQLSSFDVLIRSPGIPVSHPALKAYRRGGGAVINPSSIWFSERPDVPVVAVTGSKGKSTTASLLHHMLECAGRDAVLAGNIGVPLLDHLETRAELVVAELSSYQLADLEGRLRLGIITRLFDEHLDWHGTRTHYFVSKLRMADMLPGNPLLINATDPILSSATLAVPGRIEGNRPPGFHRLNNRIYLDQAPLVSGRELALIGQHNLDNAALALEAAHLLGCELDVIVESLRSFKPLAHRLELVAVASQRRWVNDSIATTPHATLAALQALQARKITLVAGGQARPADWQPVIDWLGSHSLAGLVILPDNGEEVAQALFAAKVIESDQVVRVTNMAEAIDESIRLSDPGGVVLLSPGAPSFPHFSNFEQRGEAFRTAVQNYRDRSTA